MKRKSIWIASLALVALLASSPLAEEAIYGEGLTDGRSVPIADLLAAPDRYVGQKVQIEGKITDVCPRRGCWIDIQGEGAAGVIRVKVEDDVIVFPTDLVGKTVRAEGMLEKIEMTEEQARAWEAHLAEEKGEAFDPASIKGPRTRYQIKGLGAVVGRPGGEPRVPQAEDPAR